MERKGKIFGKSMEELLTYAILAYQEIITKESFQNKIDELFLADCENEILLNLECENNVKKQMLYIKENIDYDSFNYNKFGKILMCLIKEYYINCSNIEEFALHMYSLWESIPGNIQDKEPFKILSYADDPLSWGDKEQSKEIYKYMLNYYKE